MAKAGPRDMWQPLLGGGFLDKFEPVSLCVIYFQGRQRSRNGWLVFGGVANEPRNLGSCSEKPGE